MNDLGNLQLRVGHAVDKLRETERKRRHSNESLGRVLNDLETKFDARKTELDHCRTRIQQLEESNRVLTGLVGELVEIVERTADQAAEDPIYRTTAAAGEIVSRYVPEMPANDKIETVAEVAEEAPAEAPRPAQSVESCGRSFEDVEADHLLAEELFERSSGGSAFPRLVHDAVANARGEIPEAEAFEDASFEEDGIDIPEPALPHDAGETGERTDNLDIEEIMARLEIATERAQSRAEADARAARDDEDKAGAGEARALSA